MKSNYAFGSLELVWGQSNNSSILSLEVFTLTPNSVYQTP